MSHITTLKVEIKDLAALREVCDKLGLEFREDQKTYKWYGHTPNKCDHAIAMKDKKNKSAYEIGVVKKGDSYTLAFDFWNKGYGIEDLAGKDCCNITQGYTRNVAVREAKKVASQNNMTVTEEVDPDTQEIILTLRSYD